MHLSQPVSTVIQQRFSCRGYQSTPIAAEKRQQLADLAASLHSGPLGTPARFALVAATEQDRRALRGLGTYGFIKGATGFIVGATGPAAEGMADFGYLMEQIVLYATDLGLGTCWLGGTFTRSSFARKIGAAAGEVVPAVVSTGNIADADSARNSPLRRSIGAANRLPWEQLFFRQRFGQPLAAEEAGAYAVPLEMVRLGPSASNKQPWRIVQEDGAWHFYVCRTPGYGNRNSFLRLLQLPDLQRIDVGIAMSHFALTAMELGLPGNWTVQEPAVARPDELTEYVVSWV